MNRRLFLSHLRDGLQGLPQPVIAEIIGDYDNHFSESAAAGRNENDVVTALGDPVWLAVEFRIVSKTESAPIFKDRNEPCAHLVAEP